MAEYFTAADAIYQIIVEDNPSVEATTFQGFTPDAQGLVREVSEGDAPARHTFGTTVAVEHSMVEVGVRGEPQDYATPRNEAIRLRYLIGAKREYVIGGLRLLAAVPDGAVEYLGRDEQRRVQFSIRFDCTMEAQHEG